MDDVRASISKYRKYINRLKTINLDIMPKLNGKGPENKDSVTGRGLGCCPNDKEKSTEQILLGQGMGKRRKAGVFKFINQHNNQNKSK